MNKQTGREKGNGTKEIQQAIFNEQKKSNRRRSEQVNEYRAKRERVGGHKQTARWVSEGGDGATTRYTADTQNVSKQGGRLSRKEHTPVNQAQVGEGEGQAKQLSI